MLHTSGSILAIIRAMAYIFNGKEMMHYVDHGRIWHFSMAFNGTARYQELYLL